MFLATVLCVVGFFLIHLVLLLERDKLYCVSWGGASGNCPEPRSGEIPDVAFQLVHR